MSKLKSLTTVLLITVLSILYGCSDEIISPLSQNIGPDQLSSADERKNDTKQFHTRVSLKPHQTVEFHSGNTIFRSFNSISILNCGYSKNSLEILGYANDAIVLLGCNSRSFFAYTITIENKSSYAVDLDVFLDGILKTKSGLPVRNDKELF